MTEAAKTLRDRAETGNVSEKMQEQVENAIEESESLEHFGTLRLDSLAKKERQTRENISLRSKLSYDVFSGDYSQFITLKKNADQLFSCFPNQP